MLQPSYRLTAKRNILSIVRNSVATRCVLAGSGVRDAVVSPAGDSVYYALARSSKVFRLDLASGVSTSLANTGAAVRSLAINDAGDRVYAAGGRAVSELAWTAGVTDKTTLANPVDAVAYDPTRGQVHAVSATPGLVTVLASSLDASGSVKLAGTALTGASKVTASIDPAGGRLQVQRADTRLVLSTPVSSILTRLSSARGPSTTIGVSRNSHRPRQSAAGALLDQATVATSMGR